MYHHSVLLDGPVTPGNTIDRYDVIAELAKGGMGTVLLARLSGAGGVSRLYALKLLHRHLMYDSEFVDMLLDEARIAAQIHHPNAVAIHELGVNESHGYYLVMDYVEGVTLWDVNAQLGPPSPGRAKLCARIVYDALLGLEAAHSLVDELGRPLRVVHRDVSPQNILVGVDGIGRVTDFGIAKAAARISGTIPGQVKGKLAYMAPEQARGKNLDHRVDIFAIGVVLWEMLTGERLFKRRIENDTIDALLTQPIPSVRSKVPSIPEEIDEVVSQALVRDPAHRFGSARAMAVALESAARGTYLFADSHEVGGWVRGTFARALETRREAIRQAASMPASRSGGSSQGGISVPAIPEVSTIAPTFDAKTVTDVEDEWEKHSETVSGLMNPGAATPPGEDPLDLMKTTAMPADAKKPAELRAAIEQYRQQFGEVRAVSDHDDRDPPDEMPMHAARSEPGAGPSSLPTPRAPAAPIPSAPAATDHPAAFAPPYAQTGNWGPVALAPSSVAPILNEASRKTDAAPGPSAGRLLWILIAIGATALLATATIVALKLL